MNICKFKVIITCLFTLLFVSGCQTSDGANWATQDFANYGKNYFQIPTYKLTPGDSKSSITSRIPVSYEVVRNQTIDGKRIETWMYETWVSNAGPDQLDHRTFLIFVDHKLVAWNETGDISTVLTSLNTQKNSIKTVKAELDFPIKKLSVIYKVGIKHPDDIAVIIGNANYKEKGKDVPNVMPAYSDAANMKDFLIQQRGLSEENIIFLSDATNADFIEVFGKKDLYKGKLYNYVRPGISNVHVYYSGHGAPGKNGKSYLVPVDASASDIELAGYSIELLYENLSKIPAKTINVVLESCFSGLSNDESIISNASPVFMKAELPINISNNMVAISAGAANQIASWEEDKSNSLFTKYYLHGISGEADQSPYGNEDGAIDSAELSRYLDSTLTYYARRYYGRDQNAQIVNNRIHLYP